MFRLLPLAFIGCGTTADPTAVESELMKNVEEIRQMELALLVVGDFTPCADEAAAKKAASIKARAWQGQKCWTEIGWKPDGEVFGGYWVEVKDDTFMVHGIGPEIGGAPRIHVIATHQDTAKRKP